MAERGVRTARDAEHCPRREMIAQERTERHRTERVRLVVISSNNALPACSSQTHATVASVAAEMAVMRAGSAAATLPNASSCNANKLLSQPQLRAVARPRTKNPSVLMRSSIGKLAAGGESATRSHLLPLAVASYRACSADDAVA